MNKNSNYPNARLDDVPVEVITRTIESVQELSSLGKITRSADMDESFEERTTLFIELCKKKGMRPGIESLCAALGITRQELHNWQNGAGNVTERRQEGVKRIKQLIYAFLEQVGMNGRLNPASYIWLCKNWMGYSDSIVIENKVNENAIAQLSREEIAARYRAQEEFREKPQLPEGID